MQEFDYKPIPESLPKYGLCLLKRVDPYALYVTNCYSFEIHKIRIQKNVKNPWNNELYNDYEKIAGSEEFGQYAWCFERLTTVIRYFTIFGEHIVEIMAKLDDLGFKQLNHSKRSVKGYLF